MGNAMLTEDSLADIFPKRLSILVDRVNILEPDGDDLNFPPPELRMIHLINSLKTISF
jgi:hypothetical protein